MNFMFFKSCFPETVPIEFSIFYFIYLFVIDLVFIHAKDAMCFVLWKKLSRQKQYFEQRKRQQQQTAVLDSHADPKEHRSLDVLSLLNLSTTAEERKCACLNGKS